MVFFPSTEGTENAHFGALGASGAGCTMDTEGPEKAEAHIWGI